MAETVENKKLEEMEELATRVYLDIGDVISTLNVIVKYDTSDLPDDQLHMKSIPALVVKELERVYEDSAEIHDYLFHRKMETESKLKEESKS